MLGTQFRPAEHPVFLAHWDGPQGPFQVVSVWLYVRVFQEHGQTRFAAEHVVQGFGQWITGQQAALFQLS
jgi:hypothetical protein